MNKNTYSPCKSPFTDLATIIPSLLTNTPLPSHCLSPLTSPWYKFPFFIFVHSRNSFYANLKFVFKLVKCYFLKYFSIPSKNLTSCTLSFAFWTFIVFSNVFSYFVKFVRTSYMSHSNWEIFNWFCIHLNLTSVYLSEIFYTIDKTLLFFVNFSK